MGTFPLLDYILNAVGVLAEGMHSRIRYVHVEFYMEEQLLYESTFMTPGRFRRRKGNIKLIMNEIQLSCSERTQKSVLDNYFRFQLCGKRIIASVMAEMDFLK